MVLNSIIDVRSTALVLIDIQNGFISDYTSQCLVHVRSVLENENFPLVVATQLYNEESSSFRRFKNWQRFDTVDEVSVPKWLKNSADYLMPKSSLSAAREIEIFVRMSGLSSVLLMGVGTETSVLQTAGQLFDVGVETFVDLRGCASTHGKEIDEIAHVIFSNTIGSRHVIKK